MRSWYFLFLFFLSTLCYSQTIRLLEVELQDSETSRLLYEFNEAKVQIDIQRMDSIWDKLSEPDRIFSQEQQALKSISYGWFYYYNDLYDEALKYFNEAYKLAERAHQRQVLLYAKAAMGNVEYTHKNIIGAIQIFQEILTQTLSQDWRLEAKLYANIAPLQHEMASKLNVSDLERGKYLKDADENYKRSISILKDHEDWESLARVYAIYSHLKFDLGEHEESKKYLAKASELALKSGSMHKYHFNLIKWGQFLYRTGAIQPGIDSLVKSVRYFNKINYKEAYHHSNSMLAHAYAENKQYDSAYSILHNMIVFRRNMNVEKMSRQSKLYRVELDVYEKEKKITAQKRELELQRYKSQLSEANRKRWVIGGISAVIIVVLVSLFFIQNIKQKGKAEKAQLIIEEREQAFRSVIEGQEAERKRIAQELHDGIGQQLSGIKMALQNMMEDMREQKVTSHEQLNTVISLVGVSASEVRQLAHQMLPQVLQEKGLSEALKDLIQITHQTTGIKFNYENQLKNSDLKEEWELTVYRGIQELINNTIKHAKAKEIDLYLYEANSNLLVAYSDNGIGIQEKSIKKGLGLNGIKHRIENLQGSFSVENFGKSGFNAVFKLPLT